VNGDRVKTLAVHNALVGARGADDEVRFDQQRIEFLPIAIARCELARHLLRSRGRHSSFIAWDWFQNAMDHFEEAARLSPDRVEPALRFNACVRLIERNRHCVPGPEDQDEHGIE